MKTKTIQKHEEQYYHIPKGRLKFIPLTLLLLVLSISCFYVIIDSWKFLELGGLSDEQTYYPHQLLIIPLLIIEYLLISFTICSIVSIFKKLKSYNEHGLMCGLIAGLIAGLMYGLIAGLMYGLIAGLIAGLIGGLIAGLMYGLIAGLICGLIAGLIAGLIGGLRYGLAGEFD